MLHSLELARERLAGYFAAPVDELTVVMHRSVVSLSLARPVVPLAWAATTPAARRYLVGWASETELHMLAPAALEGRASNVPGSREMLGRTAVALYARRLIAANNHDLPRRWGPARVRAELRWAWLLEGAARWFSGQTGYARPAIARRLHEGGAPRFPPGVRDALLLGGTVIDVMARELGEARTAEFTCHLDRHGPRRALATAFDGRPLHRTEEAWRVHLRRLVGASA